MSANPKIKKHYASVFAVAVLIAFAYTLRLLGAYVDGVVSVAMTLLRNAVFIGIVIAWAISVRERILQRFIRKSMLSCAVLMIFWLTERTCKFLFLSGHATATRYCWYGFYLPMIFIPMIAVFVAVGIGKPENYVFPKYLRILYIPSALLLAAVFTNDMHQFVFSFQNGVPTDGAGGSYNYAPLYFVVLGWIIAEALAFFVILLLKSRTPGKSKRILLPVFVASLALIYGVVYIAEIKAIRVLAGDATTVFCLIMIATFEACIKTGLIQSNKNYKELFTNSALRARITDGSFKPYLTSAGTRELSVGTMALALNSPVVLDGGVRISCAAISGGYVVWEEDVSALSEILEKLRENKADLKNANLITEANYKKERAMRAMREKNRLYDKMQKLTAPQLILENNMLKAYIKSDDENTKRRLLGELVVIGTFIKRKNNLIFSAEQSGEISPAEVEQCFFESIRALKLCGVQSSFYTNSDKAVSSDTALKVYDFFELLIEKSIESLKSVLVRLLKIENALILCVDISCDYDFSYLADDYVKVILDETDFCSLQYRILQGGESND